MFITKKHISITTRVNPQERLNKKRRFRLFLLLTIYTFSSLVSLPFLSNSTAFAASSPSQHSGVDGLDWQVKSYIYYNAVSRCFDNAHSNTGMLSNMYSSRVLVTHPFKEYSLDDGYISSSDAQAYRWFGSNIVTNDATVTVGDYLDGSFSDSVKNGTIDCGNASFISDAIKTTWGLEWYDVLCNIGLVVDDTTSDSLKYSSGTTCTQGIQATSANFFDVRKGSKVSDVPSNFRNYIKHFVYSDQEPSLNNAELYKYYFQSFNRICVPGISSLITTPPTADPGDFKVPYVDVSDSNNKHIISDRGYIGNSSGHVQYWSNDKKLEYKSCKDLANLIGTKDGDTFVYAQAYLDLYGKSTPKQQADANIDTGTTGTSKSSCNIPGVGWIVCPIVSFLAKTADSAYKLMADDFLNIDVKLVDTSSGTYTAWQNMRNIANVAFVIAFMVIIFSQITSYGIDSYGIKKMLPRLVIAALLVNLSFFVCQIAVDLSNIIGHSVGSFISGSMPSLEAATSSSGSSALNTEGLASKILVVGMVGVFWGPAFLSVLFPLILAILLSVLVVLFMLVARQVLIVLLIVIAPLAFVAYLLPNTGKWFDKWKSMFFAMLILFPVVSIIYGASHLASNIIITSFGASDAASIDMSKTDAVKQAIGLIIGYAALTVPFFVLPSVFKKSLDAIPALGALANKVGTMANSNLKSKAGDAYKNGSFARGRAIGKSQHERKVADKYARQLGRSYGLSSLISKGAVGASGGGWDGKALSSIAQSAANENFEKQVAEEAVLLKGMDYNSIKAEATSTTNSDARRVAAIRQALESGNYKDRKEIYASSSTAGEKGRIALQKGYYAAKDQKIFGGQYGDTLLAGKVTSDTDVNNQLISRILDGNIGPESLTDEKLIDHILKLNEDNLIAPDIMDAVKQQLSETASKITTSTTLQIDNSVRKKLSGELFTTPSTTSSTPPPDNHPNQKTLF